MVQIKEVIKELAARLEFILKVKPVILNSPPAVLDERDVYILVPDGTGINKDNMISSDTWINYTIEVFKIAHVQNMNRQGTTVENIYEIFDDSNYFFENVMPRENMLRVIDTANVPTINYGTSTWVTDTKIYSAYTMMLTVKDVIEDKPRKLRE